MASGRRTLLAERRGARALAGRRRPRLHRDRGVGERLQRPVERHHVGGKQHDVARYEDAPDGPNTGKPHDRRGAGGHHQGHDHLRARLPQRQVEIRAQAGRRLTLEALALERLAREGLHARIRIPGVRVVYRRARAPTHSHSASQARGGQFTVSLAQRFGWMDNLR
jgi:hypothetical protein